MVKKIFKIITNILFGIALVVSMIFVIIGLRASRRGESPVIFGRSYSVVATDSMSPTIEVGQIIIYKKIDFDELLTKIGSVRENNPIIVFINEYGMQVVHRAINVVDGKIETQGDRQDAPVDDYKITKTNLVGIVISIGKGFNLGTILLNYRNVIFVIASLILSYVLIGQIIKLMKDWALKEKAHTKEVVVEFDKEKFLQEELEKFKQELLKEKEKE